MSIQSTLRSERAPSTAEQFETHELFRFGHRRVTVCLCRQSRNYALAANRRSARARPSARGHTTVPSPFFSSTPLGAMGRSAEAGDAEGDPPRERGEVGRAEQKRKRDEPSPRELVAAANAARDVAALVGTAAAKLGPTTGSSSSADGPSATRGYVVDQLPDRLRRWCFDLTKRNMEAMYERTWGWSNPEKRRELAHSDARFIVAFRGDDDDDDDGPMGFVHFRFEVEDSDGTPVAYVYELQVEDDARGRGVGRALMARVESVAEKTRMARTMLTVLKTNAAAARFYERLGYVEDADTPRDEACHYVILTKPAGGGRGGEGAPPRRSTGVVNRR